MKKILHLSVLGREQFWIGLTTRELTLVV